MKKLTTPFANFGHVHLVRMLLVVMVVMFFVVVVVQRTQSPLGASSPLPGAAVPTLSNHKIDTDGPIYAIAVASDGTRYIGGDFSQINGQTRYNLAAIDSAGNVTTWAPAVTGTVHTLLVEGATIYFGGDFTKVNDTARLSLAAVSNAGALQPWNPGTDGSVAVLAKLNTKIYIGGNFSSVGGKAHASLAVVDTTGTVQGQGLDVNGTVAAIAIGSDCTTLYVGGDFNRISGSQRTNLAALDTSGTILPWQPTPNNQVFALATDASAVYAGGDFNLVNNEDHHYIAALNLTTGAPLAWHPEVADRVFAFGHDATSLYVGTFNQVLALDKVTAATNWSFSTTYRYIVRTLAIQPQTISLGGEFTRVGGLAHLHGAEVTSDSITTSEGVPCQAGPRTPPTPAPTAGTTATPTLTTPTPKPTAKVTTSPTPAPTAVSVASQATATPIPSASAPSLTTAPASPVPPPTQPKVAKTVTVPSVGASVKDITVTLGDASHVDAATVAFSTSQKVKATVYYDVDSSLSPAKQVTITGYALHLDEASATTSHALSLTNLKPNTAYYFTISLANGTTDGEHTFTTPAVVVTPTPAPVVSPAPVHSAVPASSLSRIRSIYSNPAFSSRFFLATLIVELLLAMGIGLSSHYLLTAHRRET